ncbi:hypothetical protein swp_2549 [Shewanella piezotolerans WP3]|uniref:Uncharacterized protein n=1 Tax=Shewanella piezotolerans (strain WP3 / JCM 13877) TaxID=225849 RepID=B8CP44_SHEPW|nr:hypothetical protein swp_2549 [Shewanella piezotolerans WP3]
MSVVFASTRGCVRGYEKTDNFTFGRDCNWYRRLCWYGGIKKTT